MTLSTDLLVRRGALSDTRIETRDLPPLEDGEALLNVDAFSITANNVTYGVFGDAMKYWAFFPAPEGFGRVPVWGFATVVESKAQGLEPGKRVYGYLPMSSHLVVTPERLTASGFRDGSAHRKPLPAAYQSYAFTDADPLYRADTEALQMLFRPLFITSFLIDDLLADSDLFGARQVVFSSASAKTAYAAAKLLSARGVPVVGLTSQRNVGFVRDLGVYETVVAYPDIGALDAAAPSAFVDIAGDSGVRARVHRQFNDALKLSLAVGATHWVEAAGGGEPLPGPQPQFFFAPDRIVKRNADWGADAFSAKSAEAFAAFLPVARAATDIVESRGLDAAARVFSGHVAGDASPKTGDIVVLG